MKKFILHIGGAVRILRTPYQKIQAGYDRGLAIRL
jgi:hypothetical protein